jgi:O-succinylbenzoic acid--CoA ligase
MARAKRPDAIAIESAERSLTYAQLSAAAIEEAAALQRGGFRYGDRAPLDTSDRVRFAIELHGCLLAGAAAVPLDPRLAAQERAARAAAGSAATPRTATVMYTSGTTSAPKPVELTLDNWLANALSSAVALGLDPGERWLCAMPLAHVGGLSILIRSAVYATTVVLHEQFSVPDVLEALMDPGQRITIVSLVPTMLARLLDAGLSAPPTLRWALLGGGPIAPALLARADAAGVAVAPTYGMTEACSQIATFGIPLHGVFLTLQGPEQEICVRGPMVAPAALDENQILRTGDLGSFDEDGRLQIIGRKADTIVSGGENVAPAEVEAVLLEHPDVADAGVKGAADDEWGEVAVAFVVMRDGCVADAAALSAFVRARLAPFKVPKRWEFVASLPRTASGKLLRRELGR